MVEEDIRMNLIVTFLQDAEYEAGDQIMIYTQPLIDEAIKEYKRSLKQRKVIK